MDVRRIVKEGYERCDYAGVFRTSAEPEAFEKALLDRFLEGIPQGGALLDLGCGVGVPYDRYFVQRG